MQDTIRDAWVAPTKQQLLGHQDLLQRVGIGAQLGASEAKLPPIWNAWPVATRVDNETVGVYRTHTSMCTDLPRVDNERGGVYRTHKSMCTDLPAATMRCIRTPRNRCRGQRFQRESGFANHFLSFPFGTQPLNPVASTLCACRAYSVLGSACAARSRAFSFSS